jgi:hypothetical protein
MGEPQPAHRPRRLARLMTARTRALAVIDDGKLKKIRSRLAAEQRAKRIDDKQKTLRFPEIYGPDVQHHTEFFADVMVWTLFLSPRAVKEISDALTG